MKKTLFVFLLSWLPLAALAGDLQLEGKIGDKYPIVLELAHDGSGIYSGKYAYSSTLKRDGDSPCSWLYISPDVDSPYSEWTVTDCHGKQVEKWHNVTVSDRGYLSARMTNSKGTTYDVAATVAGATTLHEPLNAYFREHLGDYTFEFNMFSESRIRKRLQELMGVADAIDLFNIIQVAQPIEYNSGMYWSSGFMAHQCCDPAAMWAYDTRNNSFYIWVRKDGSEYWWAESGEIPYEFRELVSSRF